MLNTASRWSSHRPGIALAVLRMVALLSLASWPWLRLTTVSEREPTRVRVEIRQPGATAERIDADLAQPIERALMGTSGIASVECISGPEGTCQLTAEMQPGIGAAVAIGLVQSRVEAISHHLPAAMNKREISVFALASRPTVIVSLFDRTDEIGGIEELARQGELLRSELEALGTVARVLAIGPRQNSHHVRLDPRRMQRAGVTVSEVFDAITTLQRSSAESAVSDQLASLALGAEETAQGVTLSDIADVTPTAAEVAAHSRVNQLPCITLVCYAEDSAFAGATSAEISERLKELSATLPSHLGCAVLADEGAFAVRTLLSFASALALALCAMIVVCFLSTADPRRTLGLLATTTCTAALTISAHALLTIPLSIGSAAAVWVVLALSVFEFLLASEDVAQNLRNATSLRGANIARLLRQRGGLALAIKLLALASAAFCLVDDSPGSEMLRPFAITLVVGLLVATVVTMTVLPAVLTLAARPSHDYRVPVVRIVAEALRGMAWSQALLARGFIWQPLMGSLLWLVLAAWFVIDWQEVSPGLLPASDRTHFCIDVVSPSNRDWTGDGVHRLATSLMNFPEVGAVAVLPGYEAAGDRLNRQCKTIVVRLRSPNLAPSPSAATVAAWIERSLPQNDGATYRIVMPAIDGGIIAANQLECRFTTAESATALTAPVERLLDEIPYLLPIAGAEASGGQRAAEPRWIANTSAAKKHGIDRDRAQSLATFFSAGHGLATGPHSDVWVDVNDEFSWRNLTVRNSRGERVTMGSLVEPEVDRSPQTLVRQNARCAANVRIVLRQGASEAAAAETIEESLATLPLGSYAVAWAGRGADLHEWRGDFQKAILYAVVGAFLVATAVCLMGHEDFAVLPSSLVVWMVLPLVLWGAAIGLRAGYIAADPLAVTGMLGAAILAFASLLTLIAAMQRRRRAGDSISASAAIAIQSHAVPLFIATLVTICGYLPLGLLPGPAPALRGSFSVPSIGGLVGMGLLVPLLAPSLLVVAQWGGERLLRRKSVEDVWRFGESVDLLHGMLDVFQSVIRHRRKHGEDLAGPIAIVTVTGSIKPAKMGTTLTQERLYYDHSGLRTSSGQREDKRAFTTLYDHLTNVRIYGGHTVIDGVTAAEGRNPIMLRDVSKATGVRILTNTGCTAAGEGHFLTSHFREGTIESVAETWTNEWRTGIDVTGVRAGFIKIGFDPTTSPAIYEKLCAIAAAVHLESGMTIASDTPDFASATRQLELLHTAGVNANAWIWLHAQREGNFQRIIEVAKRGAWIQIDEFAQNTLAARLDLIRLMQQEGVIDRLLVSQHTSGYVAGVGERTGRIARLDRVFKLLIPELFRDDFLLGQIRQITVVNPSRAFMTCVRRVAHTQDNNETESDNGKPQERSKEPRLSHGA